MGKLILIVEDEKKISEIIKFNLLREGYEVITAFDGEAGYQLAMQQKPDLILLDIMLPKMDGYTVCRKVREKYSMPILMLTARDEEVDKVLGLELGADDYITKPFGVRELMARVKAHLRRNADGNGGSENEFIKFANFEIDAEKYEVKKDGQLLELTLREFELLKFLAKQPDKLFSRESLLEQVWGYEYYGDVRTVDVTVRRLREKIEDDPSQPRHIITKRGVGYYFSGESI